MYNNHPPVQLSRYNSAPAASFLSSLEMILSGDYYTAGDSTSSSSSAAGYYPGSNNATDPDYGATAGTYVVTCGEEAPLPPQSLLRHRSSPAGFLSNDAMLHPVGSGGGYGQPQLLRMESLSSISEMSSGDELAADHILWDDSSFAFSSTPYRIAGHNDGVAIMDDLDSQLNLGETPMVDAAAMGKLLQMQQGAVPCKLRAKRGCATHPRSIAERVRRTKISEKLKRLQELVPNMDKQTNTADMLDFAVEHIRILQRQIQTLKEECDSCTCTRNPE